MRTTAWRLLTAVLSLTLLSLAVPAGSAAAAGGLTGPDVASYQHPYGARINWSAVAGHGHAFGFVKATEGSSYTNDWFARDYAGMKAAGMVRGAYHFARPGGGTRGALAQARHFVAATGTLHGTGELPGVLDLEVTGGLGRRALIAWTHAYLDEVQRLTGRKPIIYTYPSFWRDSMGNTSAFTSYPLWIATYSSAPQLVGGWKQYTFWQYSSTASVHGIATASDISVFRGTAQDLRALARSTVAPSVPTSLTARADTTGGTSVALAWGTPSAGSAPAGYRVSVDGRQVAQVPASTRRYTATRLAPGGHQLSVVAFNSAGTSRAATASATVVVRPGAPTRVRVGVAGTTVTVAWAPPAADAGALTGYRVALDGGTAVTVPAGTLTYTAAGLAPGPHSVSVVAYNRVGTSPAATASATVVVKADAPTRLRLAVTGTSIAASWAKPVLDAGELTGYRVQVDTGAVVTVPATVTGYTATGLTPGPHTVTVWAYNRIGDGATASAVATVIVRPTAPTGLRSSVSAGTVTVAWDPPVALGGELLGYQVSVDGGAPVTVSAAVTSESVPGLTPGAHRLAVAAYNSAGVSPQAATVALVLVPPGEPTAVAATTRLGTAKLTWAPPQTTGGQLSGYLVWVDGGLAHQVPAGTTSYTVSGLTAGGHVLEVAAYNSGGSSHPVLREVTVVLPPSAPTKLAARARSGAIDVTWAAPVQPGGPMGGYRVTLDGRQVAKVGAGTFATTLGSVAAGRHTVTVTGYNGAGVGVVGTVKVRVLSTPQLTATGSATRVKAGVRVTLTGATSRSLAGETVHRQVYRDGGWHNDGRTTVGRDGTYAYDFRAPAAGVTRFRFEVAATGDHYAAASPAVRLRSL